MANAIFDSEIFDPNIFDCGGPIITGAAGGGGGSGIRWGGRRKRNKTYELFESIEASLRGVLEGDEPDARTAAAPVDAPSPRRDLAEALRELTATAEGYSDLQFRVAEIRKEIEAYQKRIEEDEEEMMFF